MSDSAKKNTRLLGKSFPKSDARYKAAGAARYAGDMRPDKRGSLCGKILRSPHAHAAILSVDTTRAAALEGVYAVVTGDDITATRIGRFVRDRTALARDKVRYVGEPVAAVAAIDESTAAEALSLIDVRYQPLPAVFTPEEALAQDAPLIHPDLASYEDIGQTDRRDNQRNGVCIDRGDVDAAFAAADVVVEGTFTTQPVHQGFIEPKACTAVPGKDGKITLWASNKGPFLVREGTAASIALPLSKVRVITPAVGGDFGGKGAPTIEPICALLAVRSSRPVKIAFDTHEELATNFVRHPAIINLRLAAKTDGSLLAVDGEITFDCGAYCDGVFGMAHSCSTLQGPYDIPSLRLRGRSIYTNNIPAGHVRAPGSPQALFAVESLVDELAGRLGLNPLEVRQKNALREGDLAPGGGTSAIGRSGFDETIEKVAGYVGESMPKKKANQGIGIACGGWHLTPIGHGAHSKCVVKLNEDGTASLLTGMPENGAGQHIVLAQVVGDVLGLDPGEVEVIGGDTEITSNDPGPGGSRGTVRQAHATAFAARDARRQIFDLASSRLEANAEDLAIRDRHVYVVGSPDRRIAFSALARAAVASARGAVIGSGAAEHEEWAAVESKHATIVEEGIFCTHAALVEVDIDTGSVSVVDYVAAQDVGFALNPRNAEGQIHGSVVQGIGYALSEELVLRKGAVANPSWADYHIPAADLAPRVHAILVEQPSPLGPFGARGVGEASITPVAAAVANAVYDAVGVRIRDLPITPEKVLKALRQKKSE